MVRTKKKGKETRNAHIYVHTEKKNDLKFPTSNYHIL